MENAPVVLPQAVEREKTKLQIANADFASLEGWEGLDQLSEDVRSGDGAGLFSGQISRTVEVEPTDRGKETVFGIWAKGSGSTKKN